MTLAPPEEPFELAAVSERLDVAKKSKRFHGKLGNERRVEMEERAIARLTKEKEAMKK